MIKTQTHLSSRFLRKKYAAPIFEHVLIFLTFPDELFYFCFVAVFFLTLPVESFYLFFAGHSMIVCATDSDYRYINKNRGFLLDSNSLNN